MSRQLNLTDKPLRIGLSAGFFHADPKRALFKGKTLAFAEQDLCHWVMGAGALPYLIPALDGEGPVQTTHYVQDLDGLLLQGGHDVAPSSYGESPQKPAWAGDAIRDAYETDLIKAFLAAEKPILGCAGGRRF